MGESGAGDSGLSVRRATSGDRGAIIELCRASLGWSEDDPNEEFFAWKHDQNPFGVSPAWLAVAPDGSLAGVRVLMRWRFAGPEGPISAVRAVDTATHPDWQGRGIFKRLTLGALDELRTDGLDVVFNTPNDQSRPGYLKMGWSQVGRVPVCVRVRSPFALRNLAGARAAAQKWSADVDAGVPAALLLEDSDEVEALLEADMARTGGSGGHISTDRSAGYLRWRYSFEPLHYRALPLGSSRTEGMVLFRVRRRGTATELTICDVLAPPGAPLGSAVGYLLRNTGADYAIATRTTMGPRQGFVPAAELGPILTWRPVCRRGVPDMGDLALALGDVELF